MIRPISDDPCKECRFSEVWDFDDDFVEYRCRAGVPDNEPCDGEPERYTDYELYAMENPREWR